MRILISGQTYLPGNNGQAIFTIRLAEGLVKDGHEVAVVTPSESLSLHRTLVNGVQVYQVRAIPFQWLHPGAFFTPLPGWQIHAIMRKFRPDVVHIQDHYFLCRTVMQAARHMNIPLLGTNHFLPENLLPYLATLPLSRNAKIKVLWKLMRWTYDLLDIVTTPTETAARILKNQNLAAPVLPVSCGVDTHRFHPIDSNDREDLRTSFGLDPKKVVFLYVGRLDREKRIDLIFRAMALLRKKTGVQVQVAIAGQGSARRDLVALANRLRLGTVVKFLGYVPCERLADLYRCGDIFVMPSAEELQSIATLEAMACGRPVLAANARALPELVTRDVNGSLFEPGNPESLANEMAWMLENTGRWARMGSASRSRAAAHSIENTVRRYEEIYRRLGGIHPRSVRKPGIINSPMTLD